MPRCCRYAAPQLPGRAAWKAARCCARSGRAGAGSRDAGGGAARFLAATAGCLGSVGGGWRRLGTRWRRAGAAALHATVHAPFPYSPGATGKAHEAAAVHLHAPAALAVGAVERAQGAQHVATFADNRAAGGEVGFGQRPILTERVTRNAHTCASSLMVPRSGRKMSPTLPVSPCRFFATVSSTARAGGVAIRSCASVRNSTTSAAYSRSPLSLSESSAAVPLPLP